MKFKRKKIIIFDLAGPFFPGGCEKYFANFAHYLSKKHEVTVIKSENYIKFMDIVYFLLSRRKINSLHFLKRNIGKGKLKDIPFKALIPFSQTYREIKEMFRNADYIYAKNEFQELCVLYYFLGRKKYADKVIVGVHTPIFIPSSVRGFWKFVHNIEYKSVFYREFLNRAKYIHVNNSDYVSLIITQYKTKKNKIIHIPNPIDWETHQLKTVRNNKFTLIWLGRFTEQKGLDRLVEIIKSLSKEKFFGQLNILIGGSGEQKYIIDELANQYKNVKYLGFVDNVIEYYSQSDLSIFTAYFDTFAHAVLEPLSLGIPVISYNIPGPKDMIVNEKNGYLVNNEVEFCVAITRLFKEKMSDYEQYASMCKNIFLDANEKYARHKIFEQLELLFT